MAFLDFLPLVGDVASGIFNAASTAATNKANLQAQREQNEFNMKLATQQNDWNVEQWNRQNEYNTPAQQMARLKAAGLNPNLAYANGSALTAATGAPSAVTPHLSAFTGRIAPRVDFGQLANDAAVGIKMAREAAETKSILARTRLTEFDAGLRELQILNQRYVNSKTKTEAESWKRMIDAKIASVNANTGLAKQNAGLAREKQYQVHEQTRGAKLRNDVFSTYGSAQAAADLGLSISNRSLNEYRKSLIESQIQQNLAQASYIAGQEKVSQKTIEKMSAEIMALGPSIRGKQLENRIKEIMLKNGYKPGGSALDNIVNSVIVNLDNLSNLGIGVPLIR